MTNPLHSLRCILCSILGTMSMAVLFRDLPNEVCRWLTGHTVAALLTWYLFSTRAKSTSLTTAVNWIFNAVIGKVSPIMLATNTIGTYIFFGSWCIAASVFCYGFLPETKVGCPEYVYAHYICSHHDLYREKRWRKSIVYFSFNKWLFKHISNWDYRWMPSRSLYF